MPYVAEISRLNPSCFLFLIDQSGSMIKPISGGGGKKKCDQVADVMNRFLQTLALRCAKADGIRNYFHIGVIGYGSTAGPALKGALAGRNLVPVSDVANNPLRIEDRIKKVDDGAGGLIEQKVKFPVWFEPQASGTTAMCGALDMAWHVLSDFLVQTPACFPPIVINITDGDATHGDPEASAAMVRGLASEDGSVLLFNLHLSENNAPICEFPDREEVLGDRFAKRLFRMSSVLPPKFQEAAAHEGVAVTPTTRGFVFNADLTAVARFIDLGTQTGARTYR